MGTYAIAGDIPWTDVIVSVTLQSLDNDSIGVMFRYKDPANYYRFSMDSHRHYRRNPGGYRLKFPYTLDKISHPTDSRTKKLSEGGSSEPEVVVLDIPWESYIKIDWAKCSISRRYKQP